MPKTPCQRWFCPRRSLLTLLFCFTALSGNTIVQGDILTREATPTTSSILYGESESETTELSEMGATLPAPDSQQMEPVLASFMAMESPQADPVPEPALLPLLALLAIGGWLLAPRRGRPALV